MGRTVSATALFALCLASVFGFDASMSEAQARQCIWNKAGFVLGVEWYRPADVVKSNDGNYYIRPATKPVQRDVFPIAQGRCNENRENRIAVLKVEGAEWVKKGLQIGSGVAATALIGVVGAVACVGTAGVGCPAAVAAGSAGVAGIVTVAGEFIPEPKSLGHEPGAFAIVQPSTSHWLDVWGTVWDPQTGRGGNL